MMRDMKISNKQYYLIKEKKLKETHEKILKMLEKIRIAKSNVSIWNKQVNECNRHFEVYKKEMDMSRTWFHIDMDMFYAACELRDQPELKEKPVAVGDYAMI
jgi:DNA polymerase kappa